MTGYARTERQALCDLLLEVGPDAPTLCSGWTARDLAAHLAVRDGRPDALAGIVLPPLSGWTRHVQRQAAQQEWEALIARVRRPPLWSAARWGPVDESVNLSEMLVHHEDVRRAQPGWRPRRGLAGLQDAVWSLLAGRARLFYARVPCGVVLRRAAPGDVRIVAARDRDDRGEVEVRGEPVELLLHAFGRGDHAEVAVEGGAAAVEALAGARLGL